MKTLGEAVLSLQRQSFERGFGGVIDDLQVTLCEDEKTISIWAFRELDVPLIAHLELPCRTDETSIDYDAIIARCKALPIVKIFEDAERA